MSAAAYYPTFKYKALCLSTMYIVHISFGEEWLGIMHPVLKAGVPTKAFLYRRKEEVGFFL